MTASARSGTRWAVAAFAWTVLIGVVWLVVPAVQSSSTTLSSDGTELTESSSQTLLQSEGAGVLVPLAVPVLVTGIAVGAARSRCSRRVRYVSGGALLVGCALAAASIGAPYVPAAVGLLLAGATTPPGRFAA